MLENKSGIPPMKNLSYNEYDRLLDEISRFEENLTMDIRLLTQRLVETESRLQKSITVLMHMINNNSDKYGLA